MPDIFISYSSHDREQAELLTELLSSAGLSVWIDQSGIDVATSWSEEIVDAIDSCKAFIVMLSPSSIASHNVVKEVSLASEKRKKILPLDLEPVELPKNLQYALAGIQRAPMSNIDSIIRALSKLGLEATGAPQAPKITHEEKDHRKSLMILPFEDLSPTADNEWFANGIVSELIDALSNVKVLRVIDKQTTKEFKGYRGHLAMYAREMSIRYFVQGDVRKFGDSIKIAVSLLDIETGDHLWQDSLKGSMEDIFDIQEQVAQKVLGGLAVILSAEEKKKVDKKPTENVEAYEMRLKGSEYYGRHTKSDYERALSLFESAVQLDPAFADAYVNIANTCITIYRNYVRNDELLDRAERAAQRSKELEGETAKYYWVMSHISLQRGDAHAALQLATRAVEIDPKYAPGYEAIGHAYQALGMKEEEVKVREEEVRLRKNGRNDHFNLLIALHELGDTVKLQQAAARAIPIFERHTRLNPDDYSARVSLATIYLWNGDAPRALASANELSAIESLDGFAWCNLACTYLSCDQPSQGMAHLRHAIGKGFRNIEVLRGDPDLAPLREPMSPFHVEFEELMKEAEGTVA